MLWFVASSFDQVLMVYHFQPCEGHENSEVTFWVLPLKMNFWGPILPPKQGGSPNYHVNKKFGLFSVILHGGLMCKPPYILRIIMPNCVVVIRFDQVLMACEFLVAHTTPQPSRVTQYPSQQKIWMFLSHFARWFAV